MKDKNHASDGLPPKPPLRERIDWLDVRHNLYAGTGVGVIVVSFYWGYQHFEQVNHAAEFVTTNYIGPPLKWLAELVVGSGS